MLCKIVYIMIPRHSTELPPLSKNFALRQDLFVFISKFSFERAGAKTQERVAAAEEEKERERKQQNGEILCSIRHFQVRYDVMITEDVV